jgi:hypothetical protein
VTGKPSPFLLTDIIARHGCVPAKMIMVRHCLLSISSMLLFFEGRD